MTGQDALPIAEAVTRWQIVPKCDPRARAMADRHYNRQKPGAACFTPPGRSVVLWQPGAVWASIWQDKQDHEWPGSWMCSIFRNESAPEMSSHLIRQACAITRSQWGEPRRMITFVDDRRVRPKRDPGYCFRCAGFAEVGRTRVNGLRVLALAPADYPPAMPAYSAQLVLL